jgi:serine/threonine protein kinase
MFKRIVLIISSLIEKPLSKGSLIQSRYEIIQLLGSGSYGHSYLVFDNHFKRKAVLKALRWHKRITKNGRNGFNQEIKMLKEINHPSFPCFYESGSYGKIPYFTMEYINGKTFEQLIFEEGKQYGERESFTLSYELLEIIGSIQQEKIVHRDIRIPNIMWDGKNIKVIDVGLAKKVSNNMSERRKVHNHPRKQIDYCSDFYGIGHFLLFLLYSTYTPSKKGREKSWEEELPLSMDAKMIIRKLLQIDTPYESVEGIKHDFRKII